ncbi:hypothetical protein ACHAWF_017108, partial [Thalassiosira exigua]
DELLHKWYDEWLHVNQTASPASTASQHLPPVTPDPSGKSHAFYSVSNDAATLFRRQCYWPAPLSPTLSNLYKNFEQRRKSISFQYIQDPMEEMRLLHTMTKRFSPAFHPGESAEESIHHGTARMHKKKSRSTVGTIHDQSTFPSDYESPTRLAFQTVSKGNDENHTQQWSWNPPGHFSSRGTSQNLPFRMDMFRTMRKALQRRLQQLRPDFNGFEHGRQSGMFWYPPGGVREWHTNYLDLVGNMKGGGSPEEEEIFARQVWRMYVVRTSRDPQIDEKLSKLRKHKVDRSAIDHSAMHIIPRKDSGITLDVLREAGARPLTEEEERRQRSDEFAEDGPTAPHTKRDNANGTALDSNSVWRLPDQDGYVTLFRLPDIWHCVVSEEVHRYSLGFAFSDREVQALLHLAGVKFDRTLGNERKSDGAERDEL